MSSDRKIASARANGALSRGPLTPESRGISSMNALRHGLAAETIVLETESQQDFHSLLDSYVFEFQPQGPVEVALVQRLATAAWRMQRYDRVEAGTLDLEITRQQPFVDDEYENLTERDRLSLAFASLSNSSRVLDLLARYCTRHQRVFDHTLKSLIACQAPRKRTENSACRPKQSAHEKLQNDPNPANEHFPPFLTASSSLKRAFPAAPIHS